VEFRGEIEPTLSLDSLLNPNITVVASKMVASPQGSAKRLYQNLNVNRVVEKVIKSDKRLPGGIGRRKSGS
jgi:hypothetical protein